MIILDPNKSFVAIEVLYVEEQKKHGNIIFHFIHSQQELEEWKGKGYEMAGPQSNQAKPPTETPLPGAPIVATLKIINKLTTWWKRMTWKEQNIIFSRSLRQSSSADGKISTELDMIRYRDLKLKTCLKRWDLVDENNQPINVIDDVIDNLDPSVATELINGFEKVTEASDVEKKE